jgi:DNA processing protein
LSSPAWVALSLLEHLGLRKLNALAEAFDGDLAAAIGADERALRRVRGIGVKTAAAIRAVDLAATERAMERWRGAGIHWTTPADSDYPAPLQALADAPPILFARGSIRFGRAVAVVGTREPSPDAAEAAKRIALALAERGFAVVSGLALGIDAAAHIGAMAAPEGRTIAVLGSGILNVYPPQHRALALAVIRRGALLSEAHPEARPKPTTLVTRNRLISGLSEAVIVVQTDADGGAMHAARWAFEQGRRVYTLDCDASGNRALIDAGTPIISANLDGFEDGT